MSRQVSHCVNDLSRRMQDNVLTGSRCKQVGGGGHDSSRCKVGGECSGRCEQICKHKHVLHTTSKKKYSIKSIMNYFLALGFALQPMSCSLQSLQRPQPNPRTLDGFTLCQDWCSV